MTAIASHHRSLGFKYALKGLPYERCAELSWIINYLKSDFHRHLKYLDIGTGESPLPSFLCANTDWDITCLDKFTWVQKQKRFVEKSTALKARADRFRVIEQDLLKTDFGDESFDIITCVSVIEHFEGGADTEAVKACARLLRPGGALILTTLMNENHFAEFFLKKEVYGAEYKDAPVFYQRHYDVKSVLNRLIAPSGLVEAARTYFGDYDFQCFEKVLQRNKPLRALYAWSTPWLASRYLSFRSYPVSRREMRMNTASGIILVLTKPDLS